MHPHQKDGALSFVHAGGVSDNAVHVLEHLVDAAAGYPRKLSSSITFHDGEVKCAAKMLTFGTQFPVFWLAD